MDIGTDREDQDIFHEVISSHWNNSVDIHYLHGGIGWLCYGGSSGGVNGDLSVDFIDGCIGWFVTVDFMITLGIVGEKSEEFALLWNFTHGSARLTLTSWLGRDSKYKELVPSIFFLIV